MLALMQKYAYNLESLVAERTNQLVEEKKRTENLLLKLLPRFVDLAARLAETKTIKSFLSLCLDRWRSSSRPVGQWRRKASTR